MTHLAIRQAIPGTVQDGAAAAERANLEDASTIARRVAPAGPETAPDWRQHRWPEARRAGYFPELRLGKGSLGTNASTQIIIAPPTTVAASPGFPAHYILDESDQPPPATSGTNPTCASMQIVFHACTTLQAGWKTWRTLGVRDVKNGGWK